MAGNWIQFSFFLFNTMLNTLEVEPQANIVPKQTRKQRNFWKGWVWWCVLVVHSEGWRQKDQEFMVLHSWPGIHKSLYRKGARWSANYRNTVHWRQPVNSQQWGVGGKFKKTLRLWVYSTFRKGIWMLGKYITKFQVVGSVVFLFFHSVVLLSTYCVCAPGPVVGSSYGLRSVIDCLLVIALRLLETSI